MAIENIEQGTLPAHIKAVIALTSWKKRINTVGLTIFNLRCVCGRDFHIVLTLAEEEFPGKEQELPEDLMRMNRVGIFEILWVKKNYKAFKKWLFAAERYKTLPIITADDDCLYFCNYAEELYAKWLTNKKSNISYTISTVTPPYLLGPGTLFTPCLFNIWQFEFARYMGDFVHDDQFHRRISYNAGMKLIGLHTKWPMIFHDEIEPTNGYENNPQWKQYMDERYV